MVRYSVKSSSMVIASLIALTFTSLAWELTSMRSSSLSLSCPGSCEDDADRSEKNSSSQLALNSKNRTGIVTHFISKPTNRGLVEVCGKAVNRGGGLGMEIPCVYIFDGPNKHVDLLEQLIDVDNNPAVRTEAVADTSGKQRTSKRKKPTSDGYSKRQRK